MITVFGIKNCDTMKKAFRWLSDNNIEYRFHDFKKEGLDDATANAWISELGWENVINKRGTTWRKLPPAQQDNLSQDSAAELIMANTSVVRRPIVRHSKGWLVGYDEAQLQSLAP